MGRWRRRPSAGPPWPLPCYASCLEGAARRGKRSVGLVDGHAALRLINRAKRRSLLHYCRRHPGVPTTGMLAMDAVTTCCGMADDVPAARPPAHAPQPSKSAPSTRAAASGDAASVASSVQSSKRSSTSGAVQGAAMGAWVPAGAGRGWGWGLLRKALPRVCGCQRWVGRRGHGFPPASARTSSITLSSATQQLPTPVLSHIQ